MGQGNPVKGKSWARNKNLERKQVARRGRFRSARRASVQQALAATALCRGAAASSPPPGRRGWLIDPGFFVNPGGGASRDLTNRDEKKRAGGLA